MPRKQKKYHFIYKTTNVVTSKYYYGMHSTDNLEDSYLGSGKNLRYSINKYGKENHRREILEFVNNREKLIEREKDIVNLNEVAKEDCMNLIIGGKGGDFEWCKLGANITNKKYKHKKKEWGIKAGKAAQEKHRKNGYVLKRYDWKGKKHKPETIELMRKKRKGTGIKENNSQYGTCWITNGKENKKQNKNKSIPNGWYLGRTM